jgi:hypothetical protein
VNPIAKAVDCYSPLTAETARALRAAGHSAVGRYLGRITHGWSKALTPGEVAALKAVGLSIISVWEGAGTQRNYFTYAQGLKDGAEAALEAKALGQPPGTPIYFAVDYDAAVADLPRIRLYFDGIRKSIGPYKVGCYGGIRVVENVDADYHWQTCAWSGGRVSQRAHLYQAVVDTKVAGVAVDVNHVYRDPGWWPAQKTAANSHVIQGTPQSFDVLVNGHVFRAIVVNGTTYVLWTALQVTGVKYRYKGDGLMEINGKDVQGVVYKGDTYLPWNSIAPHVTAERVWSFTTK